MLVDHAFTIPLKLFWPNGDGPDGDSCLHQYRAVPAAEYEALRGSLGKADGEAVQAWNAGQEGRDDRLGRPEPPARRTACAGFINKPFDLRNHAKHGRRAGLGRAIQRSTNWSRRRGRKASNCSTGSQLAPRSPATWSRCTAIITASRSAIPRRPRWCWPRRDENGPYHRHLRVVAPGLPGHPAGFTRNFDLPLPAAFGV